MRILFCALGFSINFFFEFFFLQDGEAECTTADSDYII
jgi:hypothetical protein